MRDARNVKRDLRGRSLVNNEHGQGCADEQTGDGHAEKKVGAWEMRHQKATEGHGEGADDESPGGGDHHRTGGRQTTHGEIEHEIDGGEAEEGDVAEAIETALERAIASE